MEKKIIELTKPDAPYYHCLICGTENATTHLSIVRPYRENKDNVISFNVCDKCLSQMQKDIEAHQ